MQSYILGGGMTGLSAGISSGLPVFEAAEEPGGICSSYYVRPGSQQRLSQPPADENVYRFEIGGGHWIFGGDATVLHFIRTLAPVKKYYRRSSVYFHEQERYVPYPLQNHLRYLDRATVGKVLKDLTKTPGTFSTMEEWMREYFGPTLCELFFYPFHDLYTAGLYKTIAPQDAYKSPVSLAHVIQGAFDEVQSVGYNVQFVYPAEGLDMLSRRMATISDVRYGKLVTHIDVADKVLHFADGTAVPFQTLISTLPLNKMLGLTGLTVETPADPYTSVLVLNIGAIRGSACPDDHWLYNPDAQSGFHRVGFYSNVDRSFLPASARPQNDAVSIYVERAYPGGDKPTPQAIQHYCADVVRELQAWNYIREAEVVDPTWIDVAYTWQIPGSRWKQQAIQALEEHGIFPVGRYGRWIFQGIADSIRDGFYAGSSFKPLGIIENRLTAENALHRTPMHNGHGRKTAKPTTKVRNGATARVAGDD
jgi:protoporphyrinogen oxidase